MKTYLLVKSGVGAVEAIQTAPRQDYVLVTRARQVIESLGRQEAALLLWLWRLSIAEHPEYSIRRQVDGREA